MEKVWVVGNLAVTVARIDFLDPAVAGEADARERGVRVEVRPAGVVRRGSIYASPAVSLEPAFAPRACASNIVSGIDVTSDIVSVKQ